MLPDHAPEAVQEVALVDDQVSVEEAPLATEVGFADTVTVGAGGGGGMPDTMTVTEALELPPGPVQVREKLLLALSAPVDWLPEVVLLPDHAPEAMQEVALVDDQVSMEDALLATDAGLAASDTIGKGGRGALSAQLVGSDPEPPQAAIAKATRGASRDASVRSDVCIRISDSVERHSPATVRGNSDSDDLRGRLLLTPHRRNINHPHITKPEPPGTPPSLPERCPREC